MTLEQLARENGVLRSDGITPCIDPSGTRKVVMSLLAREASKSNAADCVVRVFGSQINTSSFALYTFSIGVFCQAITLVSLGSVADYGQSYTTTKNLVPKP